MQTPHRASNRARGTTPTHSTPGNGRRSQNQDLHRPHSATFACVFQSVLGINLGRRCAPAGASQARHPAGGQRAGATSGCLDGAEHHRPASTAMHANRRRHSATAEVLTGANAPVPRSASRLIPKRPTHTRRRRAVVIRLSDRDRRGRRRGHHELPGLAAFSSWRSR